MTYLYYNGEFINAEKEIITADSRGLRYGDGVFETIKVMNGAIQLASSHYERLFHGLSVLQIALPTSCTASYLSKNILELCRRNNVQQQARVRLAIYRGKGTLYKTDSSYPDLVIQAEPLAPDYLQFNEKGLIIGAYEEAKKSCDLLANLKSNNFLPYVMAALHAKQHNFDDCLVMNVHDRVCDATIANVFCVRDRIIYTPPLSEGCVEGVMRRHLLASPAFAEATAGTVVKPLTIEELEQADEVFLTNVLYGIRWVKQFRDKLYSNNLSSDLYNRYIKILALTEHL